MKTKLPQIPIWLLILTLGAVACLPKNDVEKPDDPYSGITEGRVLIPVLAHKVDMQKVQKLEESRGGTLAKMEPADPNKEKIYDLYLFKYTDKDVTETEYRVRATDKVLLKASIKPEGASLSDAVVSVKALLEKNGFDKNHFLNEMYPNTLSKDGDGLFIVEQEEKKPAAVLFKFEQYGKQHKAVPEPLKELPEKFIDHLGKPINKFRVIKKEEESYGNTLERTRKVGIGQYSNETRFALFNTKKNEYPLIYRGHSFDWDEDLPYLDTGFLTWYISAYDDPTLGFYDEVLHGIMLPNREILDLLKKNGYKFDRMHSGAGNIVFYFVNEARNRVHVLRAQEFEDIENAKMVLAINTFINQE